MTSTVRVASLLIAANAALNACAPAPASDPLAPGEVVATVDDVGISVEAAAQLLAPFDGFANNAESTRSLAELWIDYTVLAEAMAADSLLGGVDLSGVQDLQEKELKVLALRDMVIEVDTTFTEAELRERFQEDDPASQVRARHILIVPPEGATASQRDSVRLIADSLRSEIEGGADFASLAQLHSADLTANDGGDLGVFGRGQMVPEFETAAFSLAEGELSEVVETAFGFHIIRVEERFGPSFEEISDQYRVDLAARVRGEAEAEYIAGVADDADLTVLDDGPALAAQIVQNPWMPLDGAVSNQPLAEWTGGEFTAGELHSFVAMQPRGNILQLRATGDFAGMIRTFALQELLLAEAEEREIDPGTAQWDLSEPVYRQQAGSNARTLGLFPVEPASVEARQEAVRQALSHNLSGEIGLLAIGPVIGPLRLQHSVSVDQDQLTAVVARVGEIRSSEGFEPFRRARSIPEPSGDGAQDPGPAGDQTTPPTPPAP